jgi:thioredoxin-like negative regulator of GroEL
MSESSKIFGIYMLIILFMLLANMSYSQVVVTHFNAEWNKPNKVKFIGDLTDCEIIYVDIAASPKLQAKHEIIVVPTVVIFKDGEEVKRFQADISFAMKATKEDMQAEIDELLMEDF